MTELSEGVYRVVNVGTGHVLALDSTDQVTVVGEPGVEDGWQHWLLSSAPEIGEGIWFIANGLTGARLGLGEVQASEGAHVECGGTPMGWQIRTDETHPDRHRIAAWPASELVLALPGHDIGSERPGLKRYAQTSDTQQWRFQRT
ncbi:RICIN domain-containing protein [Nocardia sp. R16R-3T]